MTPTTETRVAVTSSSEQQRERLIEEIVAEVSETVPYTGISRLRDSTLAAIRRVDRRNFVEDEESPYAYINRPLGIGYGQTISQPYIVALMTDLLEIDGNSRVLEIGTGSGYQAAVLGEIAAEVYSIEIIEPLADRAAERLARLGYKNVHVRCGNGQLGWPEKAPFDAIIVTAAAEEVPDPLVEQLAVGGVLAIPVSGAPYAQSLKRIRKRADGDTEEEDVLPVVFVPLTGRARNDS